MWARLIARSLSEKYTCYHVLPSKLNINILSSFFDPRVSKYLAFPMPLNTSGTGETMLRGASIGHHCKLLQTF